MADLNQTKLKHEILQFIDIPGYEWAKSTLTLEDAKALIRKTGKVRIVVYRVLVFIRVIV